MISKELLSEVLGCMVTDIISIEKNIVKYEEKRKRFFNRNINIHELAHKVKEWAKNNKWYITIKYEVEHYQKEITISRDRTTIFGETHFYADTEPEAIFKAGDWILENR